MSDSKYSWDPISATRKLFSNGVKIDTFIKADCPATGFNPENDAYLNCKNCGKHLNFHDKKNRYCPK